MKVSLEEIRMYCKGTCTDSVEVTGVQVDTRKVSKGDLFVCLKGERVDGHMFAKDAIKAGACALLVDHKLDIDIPQLIVEDTLDGLCLIAQGYHKTINPFTIAITGSNGKTSTKDMLQSILELKAPTISTYSNQNTLIGTCLNVLRCDKDTTYLILEYGLDLPYEVRAMAQLINPDASIITSVGAMHMLSFDSVEAVAKDKLEIFNYTKNKDWCFYQGDFKELQCNFGHSFGFNPSNDFVINDITMTNDGTNFRVNGTPYKTNLLGHHQASNAGGVVALLTTLNIPTSYIQQGLMNVKLTELRSEIIKVKNATVIMDAYKSNPSSAKYALQVLNEYIFDGPKVAVLGDMRELGPQEIQLHVDVLEYIKTLNIDELYTLGDNFITALPNLVIDNINVKSYNKIERLTKDLQPLFEEHVLILIKGSRSLAMENLIEIEE